MIKTENRNQKNSLLATRLDTFKRFPKNINQKPEQLAEAGFFYEGIIDVWLL